MAANSWLQNGGASKNSPSITGSLTLNQSHVSPFLTGGVVWRIRASDTRLVCAAGSRNGTEETKLLVLDFDLDDKKIETD